MGFTENILLSLSKDELKFVEKTAFGGKDSQAKMLYDLVLKFGEEEEKVLPRFKKAAPNGNINVVRNQLNQMVLDAIYQQHAHEYPAAELSELILQINLFSEKSAFEVVKKLLSKALQIAEENELLTQHVDLLEISLLLYQTRVMTDNSDKEKIKDTIQHIWEKKNNHIQYQLLLFEQMDLLNQNFSVRTPEGKEKFDSIMNHELMLSEEKAISIKAKSSYWILKGQYYSISNQYDKAAEAFEHLIALLDSHQAIKKQRNLAYLSTCAQLATYGYILQQPERMENAIQRIRETEKYSAIEHIAAGTFIVNSNLAYFDLKKDKIGLKNTIHEAHALLQKHAKEMKPDVRLTLLLACVSGYAEYGEYDNLLDMIREFEDHIHANIRVDIRVMMYFYELIAQIETGNEQMVNDTIQNFNRFLLRNEFKSEFENIMIKFLKVISSFSNDIKNELAQLKTQLTELPQKSLLNQNRVLYQILMNMMDSRIAGKRFHEYLNEEQH
jgi:hypothetical protein